MSEPAEYQQAINDLNETYRNGIRAFAKWFAEEWSKVTPEEWKRSFDSPVPSADWFKGYQSCAESITGAVEGFLDDYHP